MFPHSLRRDIVLLLCLKAAALAVIYFAFFSPATRPAPDGSAMVEHILGGGGS